MTERRYLELSPDEGREHCLLKRRLEWLELRNSTGYRVSSSRRKELNDIYADVAGFQAFSANLASIQTESTVKSSDR